MLLNHYELKIEVNSELGFQHDLGFWKTIKEGSAT
jgi:hypothetical protein